MGLQVVPYPLLLLSYMDHTKMPSLETICPKSSQFLYIYNDHIYNLNELGLRCIIKSNQ
jgi:hypothetical protein